ncbi:hypothetical protein GOZ90_19625 [Agrobacterium vitis]|uniref:Uncharacterized protein n=1 Tax=Agrobacterium vitis TaxID=373 RepID=A0A6L6VN99_AGRVI|nr:hypothetical protein [Agrobacterium vitis]MUZ74902.1 hypothetical protein [Agrobacterium vitis]MVA19924.1 hypothetical protein [Agrobacterium vitis]
MADSENSRTLPAFTRRKMKSPTRKHDNVPRVIDRRNLLAVASRFLDARIIDPDAPERKPGPTPVREMWPRWYALHQQCARATRLRQKLEATLLQEASGPPSVTLSLNGEPQPIVIHSVAEINQLAFRLDDDQLSQARGELQKRRKQWKRAEERLGYSAAVSSEQDLIQRTGIAARVMWITPPSSLIEVSAKLHCLIVTLDPRLQHEDDPWPQLRTILKDLIRMEVRTP